MFLKLLDYMKTSGVSQSQVAAALGISKTALSQYLADKYVGDCAKIDAKVAAFLKLQEERAQNVKLEVGFVETKTAKQILSFLGLAHVLGQQGIIYGASGLGKTTALQEYQRRNPQCVLIKPDTGYTAKVLLQEICKALGVDNKGNIHDLTERVVDALRGSGRMIMVDEAELLPLRALETLRRIHDKTGCSVVLVGMPKLLLNLKGSHSEFKQLYGRVSMHLNLGDRVDDGDLKQVAIETLGLGDDGLVAALSEKAQGNMRKIAKLLENVYYLMRVNDVGFDELDVDLIDRAESFLIH